jgi:hypothetical protein
MGMNVPSNIVVVAELRRQNSTGEVEEVSTVSHAP